LVRARRGIGSSIEQLQRLQRSAAKMHVQLFRANVQDRIRSLHEDLSEKIMDGTITAIMKKHITLMTVMLFAMTFYEASACAAEQFKKLPASQIRAKFAGMELTDHVHWVEAYGATGTLTTREMGKTRVGRWRVEEDQLCVDLGQEGGRGCYEVWISGNNVELRTPGSSALPFQGVLQKSPTGR
jgi:hypothetical protein